MGAVQPQSATREATFHGGATASFSHCSGDGGVVSLSLIHHLIGSGM